MYSKYSHPIEHICKQLVHKIREQNIYLEQQLKTVIEEEWNETDSKITKKLLEFMLKTLNQVIKSKEYPTKY